MLVGQERQKERVGYKIHTGVDAGHTSRRVHMTDASITDTEPADRLSVAMRKQSMAIRPTTPMPGTRA